MTAGSPSVRGLVPSRRDGLLAHHRVRPLMLETEALEHVGRGGLNLADLQAKDLGFNATPMEWAAFFDQSAAVDALKDAYRLSSLKG